MAFSTGLLPLASGVIEAMCDFRLDGTFPEVGTSPAGCVAGFVVTAGCDTGGASKDEGTCRAGRGCSTDGAGGCAGGGACVVVASGLPVPVGLNGSDPGCAV